MSVKNIAGFGVASAKCIVILYIYIFIIIYLYDIGLYYIIYSKERLFSLPNPDQVIRSMSHLLGTWQKR